MAKQFKRSARVADLIQREVSSLLLNGVKDPRIGMVTITGAKVSDDLRHATIYFAVHGGDEERAAAQKGLDSAAGFFRSRLRDATELRLIPELHFKYDVSLDVGERIDRLLREAKAGGESES